MWCVFCMCVVWSLVWFTKITTIQTLCPAFANSKCTYLLHCAGFIGITYMCRSDNGLDRVSCYWVGANDSCETFAQNVAVCDTIMKLCAGIPTNRPRANRTNGQTNVLKWLPNKLNSTEFNGELASQLRRSLCIYEQTGGVVMSLVGTEWIHRCLTWAGEKWVVASEFRLKKT